ncbi:tryptophan--tRNA ligase [Rickettsiales endosymbiont of Trichoplax sp. H2]|uniref:tryptophan--tRNA ligase n=1 Tax=Rickettsiales endosymbiont of Trichoplax sp. H2 TaxID=2021221 RepID=UPI0012B4131F|nr:tryptophan--tRNA ligase [Rickettsiales endosymbiont of Trichoplax sp. H2]MSO14295.1 Tryptophan--tRNA ligase [Rickettsiales endosymbiont of Trichoplax sp. H2]
MNAKKRVFSGIQPTGKITIGNYLGAIKNWVAMQDQYECLFCIVDLHSLTSDFNPEELQQNIKYNIALYIAAGLDPDKVIIFQQSKISEHSELAWILSCFTQMGWLNRMTQFKDKAGKNKETANLGLYSYPVLMAADILLYDVNIVPVGEDQKQHIELARDIAISFNRKANIEVFTVPDVLINSKAKRIMSLKDASKKMSKSDPSDLSRINMSDDEDLIRKKIRKAKTDDIEGISYDPEKRPEISNLIDIYSCFTGIDANEATNNFKSSKNSEFKESLANIIIKNICPIHKKAIEILEDKKYLEQIIKDGTIRAKAIAEKNISKVKQIIGIN